MNISFLISLGITLEFQNLVDVDSVLSILEHLIGIAFVIVPYIVHIIYKYKKRK